MWWLVIISARNGKLSEPERYALLLNTSKKYIFSIYRFLLILKLQFSSINKKYLVTQ